ncbi:MAG: TPM domain-containing protein [Paludibacteraceae bacterium]|nr:TPM domain-containing protein [Paludibacteraceae bacterium]
MKHFLLTLLLAITSVFSVSAGTYTVDNLPVTTSGRKKFVCNPDHILADSTEQKLCNMLQALEDSTTVQVLVVAVENIEPQDVYSFSIDLGRKYGVGQKDKNNGLVVLLSTGMRKIRFSTGSGLGGDLPDAICKRIQYKYMTPEFKNNEWDQGMMSGMIAVCQVLGGDTELVDHLNQDGDEDDEDLGVVEIVIGFILIVIMSFWPLWIIMVLVYIVFFFMRRYRKRCPHCKKQMEKIGTKEIDGKNYNIFRCPSCGTKKDVEVQKSSSYWVWVSSFSDSSSSDSDDDGSSFGGGDFDGGGADSDF